MDFYIVGIIIGVVICIIGVIQRNNGFSIFGTFPGDFICIAGAIILLLFWYLHIIYEYGPEDPVVTDNCIPVTVMEES